MSDNSTANQLTGCGHVAQETADLVLSRLNDDSAKASTLPNTQWTIVTPRADVTMVADLIEHQANTSSGLLLCPDCLVRSLTGLKDSSDPRIREVKVHLIHQITWIYWKKAPVPSGAFPPLHLSILAAVDGTEALRCASKYRRVDQFGAVVALESMDAIVDENRRPQNISHPHTANATAAAILYEDHPKP